MRTYKVVQKEEKEKTEYLDLSSTGVDAIAITRRKGRTNADISILAL
jgi:hypothetical protein